LYGYSSSVGEDEISRMQVVSITLLNWRDIDTYSFYSSIASIGQAKPMGELESKGISVDVLSDSSRTEELPPRLQDITRINTREGLRMKLYSLLDQVATQKHQSNLSKSAAAEQSRMMALSALAVDVRRTLAQFSQTEILREMRLIIEEALDLPINDGHFAGPRVGAGGIDEGVD
jgi:hypothetical protein